MWFEIWNMAVGATLGVFAMGVGSGGAVLLVEVVRPKSENFLNPLMAFVGLIMLGMGVSGMALALGIILTEDWVWQ